MIHPLFAPPGGWEWLVILAIVILVFGASKLPELARGTGQALRIFKTETKGLRDDDADDTEPKSPGELPPTQSTGEGDQQSHPAPEQRPGPGNN